MIFRRTLLLAISLALACWWWFGGKRPVEAEKAVDGGKVAASGKFTPNATPAAKGPASAEELKNAAQGYIRELGRDELQIGSVRLNKRKRTISFPAKVAEKERPLEYALVHETGKTHEALFSTSAAVQDVHVAALLLDANGQAPVIEVTWRKHGGEAKVPLHELIGMKEGSLDAVWRYNGSVFIHGGFAASREGSLVALMNDPSALVNHPAAGALMKDDVFFAQTAKLPPESVQVTVVMTFSNQP
ncbi:MAG: hypothetical protein JNN17_17535 [Verrucomicrobiaceae bacterium]|nr:hypothetical protein [Verrucomicrobiaceae bacterium]